ncbi:hypothetical protein RO3G_15865 [Rhizopus delemar RA 99-880]|uniref:Reverse transcriptase RNase H-like domain-containing protein n=1 Tax=Rhizopus delemar (strain RA 99-880 / ATCC MYA-4621 / FGSC 9543 / NRRL 43880) TaxID=246409 RepID=I1CRS4_RHIO9|nr:hypothetical protein RO3G_15865 [Rhizopus delemar RA 99-880]|eukprot:EIE91154.1 hypothetical protein RO3G_15865 [Rhizopus delemar RA 99-880]
MSNFIDSNFVKHHNIPLYPREIPAIVQNVDGSSISSGVVTHESRLSLTTGISWLTIHNPIIHWDTRKIVFSSQFCSTNCLTYSPVVNASSENVDYKCIKADSIKATSSYDIKVVSAASFSKLVADGEIAYTLNKSTSDPQLVINTCAATDLAPCLTVNVPTKYSEYLDVFSEANASSLPDHGPADHQIPLSDGSHPPFGPIYPLSQDELKALSEYLKENLANGFIRRSSSPAAAPILFVKKKDGSLRLCVDYRGLNKITVKNRYPLPLINELMDRLSSAKVYTKLDIRNAYHRIRIAKGDEWKTAFRTNEETAEHQHHVSLVLEKLREAKLYAKAEKCEFDVDRVDFLGFTISPTGISMDQSKVSTITAWPTPKSVHDVQVFLGFANFYRRFIKDYSKLTLPITALTKKNCIFTWSSDADAAFQGLKQAFTSAPILRHFDPNSQIIVETDASDSAVAGILSQYGTDNLLHPVAFYSRKLTISEANYDIYDKELLAIVNCFETWRHYLQGASHQIIVYTDHKNLEYFASTKSLNRRQARWSIFMNSFDFVITYRPGTKNPKADALTRRSDMAFEGGDSAKQPIQQMFRPEQLALNATFEVTPSNDLCDKIIELSRSDTKLLKLIDLVKSPSTIPCKLRKRIKRYTIDPESNLLLFDNLIYVPDNNELKLELLALHHDTSLAGHFGQAKTCELLSRNYY